MRDTDKAGCGLLGTGILLTVFLIPVVVLIGGTLGMIDSAGDALFLAAFVVGPFVVAHQVAKRRKTRTDETHPSSSDTE